MFLLLCGFAFSLFSFYQYTNTQLLSHVQCKYFVVNYTVKIWSNSLHPTLLTTAGFLKIKSLKLSFMSFHLLVGGMHIKFRSLRQVCLKAPALFLIDKGAAIFCPNPTPRHH